MKTVLFTVSYLIEVEEDLVKNSDVAERFQETIFQNSSNNSIKIDKNHFAKWESSSFIVLDPKTINCGRCNKCGGWTTDKEKEDSIDGLSNGATVDGLLLCDECLPKDHRWAF